jgi:hypothetical protein
MYDALPQLTGLSFLHDYNGQRRFSELLEADSRKEPSSPLSSESRSFPEGNEPIVYNGPYPNHHPLTNMPMSNSLLGI